jgi:hypothetical protein
MPSSLAVLSAIMALPCRRGGREAECARLEIWYTVYRIEGSNPSLSAKQAFTKIPEYPKTRKYTGLAGFFMSDDAYEMC